jgi:hypothetical protein
VDAFRRAHAGGADSAERGPDPPAAAPPKAPDQGLLERLDELLADCMSQSGEEMDTLRPGPPDAPEPVVEPRESGGT